MTTNIRNVLTVNGVIDTNKSVMENIQSVADAAGAFVTFDTVGGLWSVIINRAKQYTAVSQRTAKVVTSGTVTISTSIKNIGDGSGVFNGAANSYLEIPQNSDFLFGTSAFTIECWIKKNVLSGTDFVFDFRTAANGVQPNVFVSGSNLIYRTGTTTRITAVNAIPSNQYWYHIAVSKQGTTTRLFVNGTQVGNFTDNLSYITGRPRFGSDYVGADNFRGYIDEIRVSRSARYTSSFTSSTTAFANDANTVLLLHLDSDFTDDVFGQTLDIAQTFTKSNILGPVTISGKGLEEFYNKVEFKYNSKDLQDQADIITLEVDDGDLYPNEQKNTLNFELAMVNDPVQAEYLASIELKQNRLDKIIRFATDFSALGVKAGDIILMNIDDFGDVLQNAYYRVISVSEEDTEDGSIVLSITAMEHSDDVYSTAGLVRQQRSAQTGITYEDANITVVEDRQTAGVENTTKGLLLPLAASAALRFANSLFSKKNVEEALLPKGFQVSAVNGTYRNTALATTATVYTLYHSVDFKPTYTGKYIGNFLFDQNSSGAAGLDNDIVRVGVDIVDSTGSIMATERSGGGGSWFWTDWFLGTTCNLVAGETYTLKLYYTNNTVAGGVADILATWNIFAASSTT